MLSELDNLYLINIPPTVLGLAPKTSKRFPDRGIWCYPYQGPRGSADTSMGPAPSWFAMATGILNQTVDKLNKMKLLITTILII